jgi:SAM-dependent methyltransferase
MDNDQAAFFDERVADLYDCGEGLRTVSSFDVNQRGNTEATVAFLAERAAGGPVLELAVGTGRVALPLAAHGIRVDGIDISPAMVARLRAKPAADQISVTVGDFADVAVPGLYRLIFVVFNSLCNLGTQDDQVRCFENVAAHLAADGSFVVEAFVPDPDWLRRGQYVKAEAVEADEVRLDVCRVDGVTQRLDESHVVLADGGIHLYPVVTRFVWPSELDLMARIAGLHLLERWAGWNREPFTAASGSYISVYGR